MANTLLESPTAYGTAVETTSAERWEMLDSEAIIRARNPYTCPEHLLSWLAADEGVTFWRESWSVDKKRFAIDEQIRLKPHLGKPEAIRGYLALAGTPLVASVRPGVGIHLGGEISEEARSAWLGRLPQLRIYPYRERPVTIETFLDVHCADELLAGFDVATVSRGYQAVLWQDGTETPLETISVSVRETAAQYVETMRVSLNPEDTGGWFCLDHSSLDGDDVPDRKSVV